ncbi:F-box only protein 43 [Pimephales promelas]|uniref:F-box only protein 43 n=1 Tax=Pimephales promelas TaxID=90988 RepID=UPI001955D91E|nr:F-box only protein 43 [Pimephales promelas]XP_039544812.1 F-box only protein 43 [Pimephales promelas]KAG1942867.1 F-box only protein [Pimephales promelas]
MEAAQVPGSGQLDRVFTPRRERHPNGTKATVVLHRDQARSRDSITERAAPIAWCETPKLTRKDGSLRRRLLVSRSSSEGSKSGFTTPDHLTRESFDSPDIGRTGPLSYSTLKADDSVFSCRKRRLLFSQVVTSTLESGRSGVTLTHTSLTEPDPDESIIAGPPSSPHTHDLTEDNFPHTHDLAKENFQSPVRTGKQVLDTPPDTPLEDSGFSSLGLDRSHDSSVDHEGSFQELVLPGSSGREKRRSRLERQRRLSTLREGGSQSEDGPRGPRADPHKDEVFLDGTPLSAATLQMQDLSLTPALQAVLSISRHGSSLEDLLLEGPVRTSLPLSGLIGRKMGLDKVDVISELRMRNLRHVLAVILSLLSAADIYRFGQVCEDWSDVIAEDRRAAHRRRCHIRELKISLTLEGGKPAHVPDADTRAALVCRSALGSVQAQARTPLAPPPVTPTHASARRRQFLQVAETLFSDEHLKPCPRCEHPARCHSLRAEGVCSWSDCRFRFCTACSSSFHGARDCAHQSAKRRSRRDVLPGSAQSRRNVRRL